MPAPPEQLDLFIQYDAIDIYIRALRMGDFQFFSSLFFTLAHMYRQCLAKALSSYAVVPVRARARERRVPTNVTSV